MSIAIGLGGRHAIGLGMLSVSRCRSRNRQIMLHHNVSRKFAQLGFALHLISSR
jgi:hypothetical protein